MRCISAMYLMAAEPGESVDGDIFAPVAEPLAVAVLPTGLTAVVGPSAQPGYQFR